MEISLLRNPKSNRAGEKESEETVPAWYTVLKERLFLEEDGLMSVKISVILKNLGLSPNLNGYYYLKTAIGIGVRTPLAAGHITKMIYPEVARQYHTSVSSVERSIRHSVDVIWERGNREPYYYLSGQYGRGKPTNSEFVSYLAEYIRFVDDCGRNLLA